MIRKYKPASSRFSRPGTGSGPTGDGIGSIIDLFQSAVGFFRDYRAVSLGLLIGILVAFLVILITDFYQVRSLATYQPNITTKIFDKNGVLISELFRQKREIVPLDKIPRDLINAFIAIEDNEFYDHWGISPKGIARAFLKNIFSGRIKQGGSTITQQLAKILLTSQKRNIYRKIKEACIALMIELFYSKPEILELYLNQIFLGHGAYGVESAARFYFDKHVHELNLAECALLATLPSAPNRLSPIRYPQRSIERHKMVFARMVEMGTTTIPEAEKAFAEFWPDYSTYINEMAPSLNTWSSRIDKAPWFTEYVRQKLVKTYGEETVYEKGLLVYTTLDVNKQMAGQKILNEALERQSAISSRLSFKNEDYFVDNFSETVDVFSLFFNLPSFTRSGTRGGKKLNDHLQQSLVDELEGLNYLVGIGPIDLLLDGYKKNYLNVKDFQKVEGCIISIDQRTGYIEAMVGGSDFSSSNQLNRTLQSYRQPGSSIKPLIYSAAFESGKFTPATGVMDSPIMYLDAERGDWIPENYEGEYYGLLRLRSALAKSINVVSIRIAETIGLEYATKIMARLLKFDEKEAKKRIPQNLSIALGSCELSPYELTRAYAIIANGGRDVVPFAIRYIKDRTGKILENREKEVQLLLENEQKNGLIQIIKPETAQAMISMLQTVISGGTGRGASIGRAAGGKTGTTNNWKDAWFVGFTPQLTTGIWVGYDKLGLSLGIGQAGGGVVAPVWSRYMRAALKNEPALAFPRFAGLPGHSVCAHSGLLPSSHCKDVVEEIFLPNTKPDKECNFCQEGMSRLHLVKQGPEENISLEQKRSIINNIDRDKNDREPIINNEEDDLLE